MPAAHPSEVDDDTWRWLRGRLWHVTTPHRWGGIYQDRAIRPDIPDAPYEWAFCRLIGAVSLFDMSAGAEGVDEAARDWLAWLSGGADRVRLWIEVDRDAIATRFIAPEELRGRVRRNIETRQFWPPPKFIQHVEAGHVGPIALDALRAVMLTGAPGRFEWCTDLADVAERASRYASAAPPDNGIGARMEAARLAMRARDGS